MSAFNFQLPRELEASAKLLGQSDEYRVLHRLPTIGECWVNWPRDGEVMLAVLDAETTGLDPSRDEMIELAVTLVGINQAGRLSHIQETMSWLEQPSVPLEPDIIRVTGLTDADLAGQSFDEQVIAATLSRADVLVSHNAKFDRAFLVRRFPDLVQKPWGCTVSDMDWQSHGLSGRALPHLLFEAGFYFEAHRAAPDCWALVCLLSSYAKDGRTYAAHLLDAVRRPTIRIAANDAPFAVKDRLKSRGYRWNQIERVWAKEISPEREEEERAWLDELCLLIRPTAQSIDAYARHA